MYHSKVFPTNSVPTVLYFARSTCIYIIYVYMHAEFVRITEFGVLAYKTA